MKREIRLSKSEDIPLMLRMFEHSREIMRSQGNTVQWTDGYPGVEAINYDLARNVSHIILEDGKPIGTFAFIIGDEPTYHVIEHGAWIDDKSTYGTIHRLACLPNVHGVAQSCFEWCASQFHNLRVDTHVKNQSMIHVVEKFGFQYCGVITIANGTPRNAYQKIIK